MMRNEAMSNITLTADPQGIKITVHFPSEIEDITTVTEVVLPWKQFHEYYKDYLSFNEPN